jgi:hypothetical protein
VRTTPWEDALDQFVACREGLEDPRTAMPGCMTFHELLMIALCTVLCGGQGAVDMALFAKAKERYLLPQTGERGGQPRYVQSAVPTARSSAIPRCISAVHGALFQGITSPTESQIAATTRQFPLAATRLQFGSSGDFNLEGEGCGPSRWERHARTLSNVCG